MSENPSSEVPLSLLEEAEALITISKVLGGIEDINRNFERELQVKDLSAIGYLIRHSADRIKILQEHVELTYRDIPAHKLKKTCESLTGMKQHGGGHHES